MFFNAITFKDSATPFAEALVELHHEIMFYLIVIVSVVIFILVNAVNITRFRESYFYSQIFSLTSFFKSIFLNSLFLPLFNKFLYSSYYFKLSARVSDFLTNLLYLFISKGGSYLNYFLRTILFTKAAFLNFLSIFGSVETTVSKLFGDFKSLDSKGLLPNPVISNGFFYKTRSSSSYLSYISNIVSYLSVLSLFNDLDYKNFYRNKNLYFSYFYNISSFNNTFISSRSVTNALDLNSLESLHSSNDVPNFAELNSHFFSFFFNFLNFKFSTGKSLKFSNTKLSNIAPSTPRSLYSFLNAQTYTVHNTKLEIV